MLPLPGPTHPDTGHGPLSSGFQLTATNTRPMYGLSAVFTIVELSNDATLSDLTIEGATDGETFTLSPNSIKTPSPTRQQSPTGSTP